MPPTDKPMLTKRECEVIAMHVGSQPYRTVLTALNTIEVFAELLERWQKSQTPTSRLLVSRQELEGLWTDTHALLSHYHGTGTSEQEGGGA